MIGQIRRPEAPAVLTWSLLAALVAVVGCNGGSDAPTSPTDPVTQRDSSDLPVLVSSTTPDGTPLASSGTMAAYRVSLDLATMKGTLSPLLRSAQVGDPEFKEPGDSLLLDATGFFQQSPCSDCLRIDGLGINGLNEVLVTIGLRHPFPIPAATLPIEKQRWDLHIFDAAGIVLSAPTDEVVPDFHADPSFIQNPDGFTSQVNYVVATLFPAFTATAHPYKILSRDNTVGNADPNDPSGWTQFGEPRGQNVLPMGSAYLTTTYRMRMPSNASTLDFGFVLTAAYGASSQGKGGALGQRARPRYFLPEFHRKEAWQVRATVEANGLRDNVQSSSAEVRVEAWDWQNGATTMAEAFDFLTSPLDQVTRASNINRIELAIPDLMPSTLTNTATEFTGSGQYDDPLKTTFLVLNNQLATLGDHWGLLTVIDDLDGNSDEPQWLLLRDDFPSFAPEAPVYRTYLPVLVPITNGNRQPIAEFTSPTFTATEEETVTIIGCDSSDPDAGLGPIGDLVEYQWDFEWDGDPANFSPDQVTTSCSTTHVFSTPIGDPDPVFIGLRVKDNGGAVALESDIVGLPYVIEASQPPICNVVAPLATDTFQAGDTVTFTGNGSDPDSGNGPAGDIVTVEWDFDWDSVPGNFVADVTNPTGAVTWVYPTSGMPTAAIRLTDGTLPGQQSICSVRFAVTPAPTPPATPVGDVTLTLNRTAGNGPNPGSFRPVNIVLGWADITGELEYAIYADYTPLGTGELLDDLQLVMTVPANTITQTLSLPGNLQVRAAYVVRARSKVGNALSETANSQVAFIELQGFEPPSFGGWIVGNQDPVSSFGGNILDPDFVNTGNGSLVTRFNDGTRGFLQDFGGTISETRWSAATSPRLPDLPNIATQVSVAKIEAVHRGSGWSPGGISQAQYFFGSATAAPTSDAGNSNPSDPNRPGRSFTAFRITNTFVEGTPYNIFSGATGPGGTCGTSNNSVANGTGPFAGAPAVFTLAADNQKRGFAWCDGVVGSVENADWVYTSYAFTADYKATAAPLRRYAGIAVGSTATGTQTGILADLNVDDVAVIIY